MKKTKKTVKVKRATKKPASYLRRGYFRVVAGKKPVYVKPARVKLA